MEVSNSRALATAVRRLELLRKQEDYDPNVPGSRPTSAQQEIIDDFGKVPTQWIVSSNRSGKSQTCARLLSWALTDTHPSWKMPSEWANEGLLILVAGKNSKQIEESLWHKIRSYLEPGSYKEIRIGNILQKVEILNKYSDNKHRIIFQSMENVNIARERIQSYDAHIAWADEMIDSASAINEIRLRVSTKGGYFLCSFTPLLPSPTVKRLVDGAKLPSAKKYVLKTLDNPVFQDPERREALLATFAGASASEIATRLEGEWAIGETNVYHFDYDTMVNLPQGYSTMWRHVESVDPALKSALGLTVWAENPHDNVWYCVMAQYIKGIYVPTELVDEVFNRTKHLNIVKRISDPHEVWYIQTAASKGIHYTGVYKKNERKGELIKQLQQKLGNTMQLSPEATNLIEELQTCRWADGDQTKMINSSSYHLLDSAQYFADQIPRPEHRIIASSWEDQLYQQHCRRKEAQYKKVVQVEKQRERRRTYMLSRRDRRKVI